MDDPVVCFLYRNTGDKALILVSFDIETEVKIPVEELYELRVFFEIGDNTVRYHDYLFLNGETGIRVLVSSEPFDRSLQKMLGLVGDQVVDYVLLVSEIEVEGSFGDARAVDDI